MAINRGRHVQYHLMYIIICTFLALASCIHVDAHFLNMEVGAFWMAPRFPWKLHTPLLPLAAHMLLEPRS